MEGLPVDCMCIARALTGSGTADPKAILHRERTSERSGTNARVSLIIGPPE